MKYIKFIAMLLLPLSFVACSDDEEFNSGEATVGFEQTTVSVSEKVQMIEVPVTVTGDHNGMIKVNIIAKNAQGIQMELDKNVILTSNTLVFPVEVNNVNAEIRSLIETNTDDFNRSFTLEITSAEGAQIGNATCQVNISEVVDPYEKLQGVYTFTAVDITSENGATESFDVELTPNVAGKSYLVRGFDGQLVDWADEEKGEFWSLNYNESGQTLSVVKGDYYAKGVNFGFLGDAFVTPFALNQDGTGVELTSSWDATWNDSYTTITFEEDAIIGAGIDAGGQYAGWFSAYTGITLTKK